MRRLLGIAIFLGMETFACAQSIEDLNIQFHGYATQGFLYTNDNNLFTANTSDGSPAWTEAVLNITSQPTPKLRIGAQGRFFLLGDYGDGQTVSLDWASGDYKASDRFGVRFGKVKTPWGLFNEIQDIDPAYIWTLLPQGIYPLTDRTGYLTHYGGIAYGTLNIHMAGKLEYRGWAGEGYYPSNDGYYIANAQTGYSLPNDIHGPLFGGALHWRTPLRGLTIGASDLTDTRWSAVQTYTGTAGTVTGSYALPANSQPNFFATYERNKLMVAFEYERNWGDEMNLFPTAPSVAFSVRNDDRSEYGMATYKVSSKLTAGVYWSGNSDHQAPLNFQRHSKDWTISGRYDFNQFLYAKAEQHFIDGAGISQIFDITHNSDLKPNTRLTALKIGVTF
jgi:hypothetical protein